MNVEDFEACWHANIHRVVGYSERHVGPDAAGDIAAATFLTAWRAWEEIPPEPLPWLISVARGHVRNHQRAARRRLSLEQRLALLEASAYAGPDAGVTATQRSEALATLAGLSESEREAVLLVAWEGLSPEQAARVLGCRPGALRMRLSRARARIDGSISHPFRSVTRSAP